MSTLRFDVDLGSPTLTSLDVPVEVRKPNLAVVAYTLSSQSVELEPGTYFVSARLPAGQELSSQVVLGQGDAVTVMLAAEAADTAPNDWQVIPHFLTRQAVPPPLTLGLETLGGPAPGPAAKLRFFSGNPFQGTAVEIGLVKPPNAYGNGTAHFAIQGNGSFTAAQLLQPGSPGVNLALPVGPGGTCDVFVSQQAGGTLAISVHLGNQEADLLLRYREQGLVQQAVVAGTSQTLSAEALLQAKMTDPIAAAVGAYALLRFGDLDGLHDWTANLHQWFPWLPDGAALRGEHLARLGDHAAALPVFLELGQRGLPLFSEGLSYAVDRMRLYIKLGRQAFDSDRLKQAGTLLGQLQRWTTFMDFKKPLLQWMGTDPNRPDEVPLDDLTTITGLDVGQYLS